MKDIKDNFIPAEEAEQLHDLGFRDECLAHLVGFGDGTVEGHNYVIKEKRVFINGETPTSEEIGEDLELHQFGICRVPLWQQAFEFFREKYNYHREIYYNKGREKWEWCIHYLIDYSQIEDSSQSFYDTYEEAQLECLRALIKLTKDDTKRES